MMHPIRIIARLDIKGPNLVKGIHLEGLRVLGKPEFFAEQYFLDGVDELIYIDSVASLYGRNNLLEIVKKAARNIFIPLTVGGGIRSIEDIHRLLRAGADKVAINTAAIKNPNLIREAAEVFGSQCIVLSIQSRQYLRGQHECLTDNGREKTGLNVFDWARKGVDLGAGEILITSIDCEGTGRGYEEELVLKLSEMVPVPVIAHGGAGKKEHLLSVIKNGRADAVCAASVFHYALLHLSSKSGPFNDVNAEFLKNNLPLPAQTRKGIESIRIGALKSYLIENGIPIRRASEMAHARK